MVLEPKFTDYGSIHSSEVPQQHITHNLLSPRSVLSTLDEDEVPNTSKSTKMTQGNLRNFLLSLPFVKKINGYRLDFY